MSIVHYIAAAAEGGGTVIVQQHSQSENRCNPYNQWILIHKHIYLSTKYNK